MWPSMTCARKYATYKLQGYKTKQERYLSFPGPSFSGPITTVMLLSQALRLLSLSPPCSYVVYSPFNLSCFTEKAISKNSCSSLT